MSIIFSKLVMTMLILYITIIMTEDMVKADIVIMAATQVVLMATFIKQNSCK